MKNELKRLDVLKGMRTYKGWFKPVSVPRLSDRWILSLSEGEGKAWIKI